MNKWKRFFNLIKNPNNKFLFALYLVTIIFIISSIIMVTIGDLKIPYNIISYIVYFFALILLVYSVYTIVVFTPRIKHKITSYFKRYKFLNKMIEQYGFRTIVFAIFSFIISTTNACINGIIGIINLSVWYIALGIYYLILSTMRGCVLTYHRNRKKLNEKEIKLKDIKTYRTCGLLLILLPLALSFTILEIVENDMSFIRSGLAIYFAATYTFYKITMSIVNYFKARRGKEMEIRAIRNINLADALVSILALQTAMFHEFSPSESFGVANAVTGAAVCLITALIGVVMIINGSKKINNLKIDSLVSSYLGKEVHIVIDRPIGYTHPKYSNIIYPVNYGYIPNVISGDGEEIDVYLLGVKTPVKEYDARIIGIIHRHNDIEDKLVAAPIDLFYTKEEIEKEVYFQEQYFEIDIEVLE